jgi:protein-S-isoprenylcysteine O-methyltransferase Ste14
MLVLCVIALRDYHRPHGDARLDAAWEVLCLLVASAGLLLRVFTVGHSPRGTSGRNTREQQAESLSTSGMYSVVRHPLYLGNFFMGLGVAMFPRAAWLPLVYVLVFWIYYERIMLAEEAFLRERFGARFETWARRTPAMIPNPRLWIPPDLPFSFRTVLRREYSGVLGVIVALFVLEFIGDLRTEHRAEIDPMWAVLLTGAVLLWVLLRTLKRNTRLLDVDGR